jgi:hypothetical protein
MEIVPVELLQHGHYLLVLFQDIFLFTKPRIEKIRSKTSHLSPVPVSQLFHVEQGVQYRYWNPKKL